MNALQHHVCNHVLGFDKEASSASIRAHQLSHPSGAHLVRIHSHPYGPFQKRRCHRYCSENCLRQTFRQPCDTLRRHRFYDTRFFRLDLFRIGGWTDSNGPPELATTLRQPCDSLPPTSADFYRKSRGKAASYRIPIVASRLKNPSRSDLGQAWDG